MKNTELFIYSWHSKWGNKQVIEREVRRHAPINTLRYTDTGEIGG